MTRSDSPKKVDLGPQAEDDVQRFVEHAFSCDFVFRSPQRLDRGKEREATDVFALFDDIAMPIEVKSQAYNSDGRPRVADLGWARKNLKKAVAQLGGAVRTIRAGQIMRLENARRGSVQFSTDMFRYVYSVAVLNHVSAPFAPMELAPEIADFIAPLHVLSFVDFYNIVHVLDTPLDLICYLEVRTQILIPRFHPKVHEEMPVLEFYLDHFEELTSAYAELRGEQRSPDGFDGDLLRRIYRGETIDVGPSYFIDKMIDQIHDADPASPSPFEGTNTPRDYVEVATHLGRLPRSRRAYIGRAFVEAIQGAGKSKQDDLAHFSSELRSDCLLFLASHRSDTERKERTEELFRLLWLLKVTRQAKMAIGIVTEAGFGRHRSFDFLILEGDPQYIRSLPDYDEIKRRGEQLFGTAVPRC